MSAEQFHLLRDHVYAYCGILVREDMKFVMERRLWPRLEALGLTDFGAYHTYLRQDPQRRAELESAVEALTTHETYFFREPVQLKAFSEEILPMLHQRNAATKRLRIWSAGCSTGEEAYTVAILLKESRLFESWEVEVYGSDISRRVLATARRAEYGPSSMRATSSRWRPTGSACAMTCGAGCRSGTSTCWTPSRACSCRAWTSSSAAT